MKSSRAVSKRCRPQLGTFVEISVSGEERESLSAIERGFHAIQDVERLMSFHSPSSELTQLNRAPVGEWIAIDPKLARVLSFARQLQQKSDHRFNVAIADPLIHWRKLPGEAHPEFSPRYLREFCFEVEGNRARRTRSARLDLGGVAKGYAVDFAVESIRSAAPHLSGLINAGGDLRAFGPEAKTVWVRSPSGGQDEPPLLHAVEVKDQALASSSIISLDGHSAYVDVATEGSAIQPATVSVRAASCMVADAMTKIFLLLSRASALAIAREHDAEPVLMV